MPFEIETYIPTLAIRASEMNGLEFLPGLSKDRMVPLILLAPWSSSHSLDRAMQRVERAFPRRKFFLDVDRDYEPTNTDSSAQAEWLELRDPTKMFRAWRDFYAEYPLVMPCLQLEGQDEEEIRRQAHDAQERGVEFCLRIELVRMPKNLNVAVDALVSLGTADFTVVIEGGWVQDPLSLQATAHGLITGVLSQLDGRVPIAVSCTSIKKNFTDISGIRRHDFTNRALLNELRRTSNRETVLYGDWGSTKPRDNSFGKPPQPRIDYPNDNAWYIARNAEESWGYKEAAQAIISDPSWDGDLNIWGEEMIAGTAINPSFAIDTPQKNIAARVNIHLHLQALYGQEFSGIDLDEEWVD